MPVDSCKFSIPGNHMAYQCINMQLWTHMERSLPIYGNYNKANRRYVSERLAVSQNGTV